MSSLRTRPERPQGLVMYDGPSMIDGKPIVMIATGFKRRSANPKTGDMIQTWILRRYVHPFAAIHNGGDKSICGDCPMRGFIDRSEGGSVNRARSCYVSVHQAPNGIWGAYKRGVYTAFDASKHLDLFRGRMIRLGAYGDPCAVPYASWITAVNASIGRSGYTHQWRNGRFWRFRRLIMASVESIDQSQQAHDKGWRTFRTAPTGSLPIVGEFVCPASAEGGYRLTCEQCGVCNGANGNAKRASVVIQAHGSPSILGSYRRTFENGGEQ